MAIDDNLATVRDSYEIAIGAATVTAVAALESLLLDLIPENQLPPKEESAIHKLMTIFMKRRGVTRSKRRRINILLHKVSERRNQFAHAFTGSYFYPNELVESMFTKRAIEDTFSTVVELAVFMEKLELEHSA
jgi:hypothetical protein